MPLNFYRHSRRATLGLLAFSTALTAPVGAADQIAGEAEQIEFVADQVSYDAKAGEIVAIGRVRLERDGYVLQAGEVRYNEKTGHAEASGAVELTTPTGERIIAPHISLDDGLAKAFVEDIRLLMQDGAQVRAVSGARDGNTTTLDHAVYSPCKVCTDEGYEEPLWQLKAVKVVHDREKRRLYYKNATLEVMGVPILWTPYFSHPDPTVDKASGFLPLDIQTSKNLGFVVGVPYYHVFSDSADATIKPIMTTKEGPVLAAEYRQHLGFGQFKTDGSITYADERDANNMVTGAHELRGHIRSDGTFKHSANWRSTYQLAWASDDTYLRRYDFSNDDTLMSAYKLEGFYGASYISARTMAFQGLRQEDVAGLTAFALPLIDADYVAPFKPLGGTLHLGGNALALHRTDGLDSQRLSVSANWQRRWITPMGFVLDADALVRADAYNFNDLDRPDDPAFTGSFSDTSTDTSQSETRTLARFSTTVTWPLVKIGANSTHMIEPIVEVTVSPERKSASDVVNEDSRAFELTDLNLFSGERASGYDLWEDGSRVTYGLRWRYDGNDLRTRVMVGQSLRITGNELVFAEGAGLEGDFSDFVGKTEIYYKNWLELEHRYRLDDKTLGFRRNEANIRLGTDKTGLILGYFKLDRELNFINREDREEIRADAYIGLTDSWKLYGGVTHRLTGAVIGDTSEGAGGVDYNVGVTYANECIELGLRLKKTFTEDRDIEPGTSILFRLKLKNLG